MYRTAINRVSILVLVLHSILVLVLFIVTENSFPLLTSWGSRSICTVQPVTELLECFTGGILGLPNKFPLEKTIIELLHKILVTHTSSARCFIYISLNSPDAFMVEINLSANSEVTKDGNTSQGLFPNI